MDFTLTFKYINKPLGLAFSFAGLWKYLLSTTPQIPLGQDFIFHFFCLLLYPTGCSDKQCSLLIYKIRLLWKGSTYYRSLLSVTSPVFQSSASSGGVSVRPRLKLSSGLPLLLGCNSKMSKWPFRPDRIWGLISLTFPKPLVICSFGSLNYLLLGLLHVVFPVHGKTFPSASSSSRSQFKCQLLPTTMGKTALPITF